jgi:hypothetical protein
VVATDDPSPDGSITLRRGERLIELNATAAALWALCDGHTAVVEIVEAASALFSSPDGNIESDIMTTLEALEDQGLVAR